MPGPSHKGNFFGVAAVLLGGVHLLGYGILQLTWNITGRSTGPDEIAFWPLAWLLLGIMVGPLAVLLGVAGLVAVRRGSAANARQAWVGLVLGLLSTAPAAAIIILQILPLFIGQPGTMVTART